jgi:RNA polymerase sigma factor (sigma-70 family)
LNTSEVVQRAAWSVRQKYRSYVELEDLQSVGLLWVWEHPGQIAEFEADEKFGLWNLRRRLYDAMKVYAEKEKAQKSGYHIADQAAYGIKQIESLLPAVFAEDPAQPVTDTPEISGKSDPAQGGNYLVSFLDVKYALDGAELSDQEQTILGMMYGDGHSQEAIADLLDVDQSTVSRARTRSLRKLQTFLGGAGTKGCPYDCECHEGRLRRRPGLLS